MQYPVAIFHKGDDFYVNVPDIPDLAITGQNMAEVIANTRINVIVHLHQLIENDKKIPQPHPINTYLSNPDYAGCTWTIVSVELARIMGESVDFELQLPVKLFKQLSQKFPDEPMEKIVLNALKQYLNP